MPAHATMTPEEQPGRPRQCLPHVSHTENSQALTLLEQTSNTSLSETLQQSRHDASCLPVYSSQAAPTHQLLEGTPLSVHS